MLLTIDNYSAGFDNNDALPPFGFLTQSNCFKAEDTFDNQAFIEACNFSKPLLQQENIYPFEDFQSQSTHCIAAPVYLESGSVLTSDMDLSDLVRTDNPNVWCTRLPQHYRSNKSLPNTFAVVIQDPNIPIGTQVVVSAGNNDNPSAALRNNSAVVTSEVQGLGKVAKFSDLRFVGRSGRGKYFSVTVSILSEPKLVATYHRAIKVTVDGPRSSRKFPPSVGGRLKQVSSLRGVSSPLQGAACSLGSDNSYFSCASDTTGSNSNSPTSSLCQTPPQDQIERKVNLLTSAHSYLISSPTQSLTPASQSVSPPTSLDQGSNNDCYSSSAYYYASPEVPQHVSQSWPGDQTTNAPENFSQPSAGMFATNSFQSPSYSANQMCSSLPGTHNSTPSPDWRLMQPTFVNKNEQRKTSIDSGVNPTSFHQQLPPVQTFQQLNNSTPLLQETSVTTKCISYINPQSVFTGYPHFPNFQTQVQPQQQPNCVSSSSAQELNQQSNNTNTLTWNDQGSVGCLQGQFLNTNPYFSASYPTLLSNQVEFKQSATNFGFLSSSQLASTFNPKVNFTPVSAACNPDGYSEMDNPVGAFGMNMKGESDKEQSSAFAEDFLSVADFGSTEDDLESIHPMLLTNEVLGSNDQLWRPY